MKKKSSHGTYIAHEKALIHPGAKIGEGTKIWAFVNVQDGAVIGKKCKIADGCYIEKGAFVGDYVTLKNNVSIFEGVTVEDDVFIGANVAFINDRYPRGHRLDQWSLEKTIVKKGATLGANATILCGITIGEYALIGAGSVVTKNVPRHALICGNPGKLKGYVCECGRPMNRRFKCVCGRKYILKNKKLVLDE